MASWPGQNRRAAASLTMATGLCVVPVRDGEVASRGDWRPKRREVAGRDDVPVHDEEATVRPGRTWNLERFTSDFEPARQRNGNRRALHARERADAIDQRAREAPSRRRRVSRLRQIDRRELDIPRDRTPDRLTPPAATRA